MKIAGKNYIHHKVWKKYIVQEVLQSEQESFLMKFGLKEEKLMLKKKNHELVITKHHPSVLKKKISRRK